MAPAGRGGARPVRGLRPDRWPVRAAAGDRRRPVGGAGPGVVGGGMGDRTGRAGGGLAVTPASARWCVMPSRRAFLTAGLVAGATVVVPAAGLSGYVWTRARRTNVGRVRFERRLPIPPLAEVPAPAPRGRPGHHRHRGGAELAQHRQAVSACRRTVRVVSSPSSRSASGCRLPSWCSAALTRAGPAGLVVGTPQRAGTGPRASGRGARDEAPAAPAAMDSRPRPRPASPWSTSLADSG